MRWFVGLMVVLMLAGCCTERLTRETLLPGIAEGQTEIVVHWPAGVAVDDVDTVDVNGIRSRSGR